MTIQVTTGGPVASLGEIVEADWTFSSLAAAIADDIDDTTNEYNSQIQAALFAAIRYCERRPYFFNETLDVTFPTVSGQQIYDGMDHPQIPRLVHIVAAYLEKADGTRSRMGRWTPQEIEEVSDISAARGEPYAFTYFAQQIRIYPIPQGETYTVRLQLGPYRLAPISSPSDSNVWTNEARDMIKARAKYVIAKDTLKDPAMAAEALNDFNDQEQALAAETSRRVGRGYIEPTSF